MSIPRGGSFIKTEMIPEKTIHEAIYRECREELGLEIENVVLTGLVFEGEVNSRAF